MVSDNGKPDWLPMQYVISNIESKRPENRNKYYPLAIGKRCAIEILARQATSWLWIEGLREWEEYSHYHTSPVLEVRGDAAELLIETENAVYTLVRIAE